MSIYELWYAIALHWFDGVTCLEVLELYALTMTNVTMIGFAMLPMWFMRGMRWRKKE